MSSKLPNSTFRKHKYIITGINGFIGEQIALSLSKGDYLGLSREIHDLSLPIQDSVVLNHDQYDTVIHAAGYTHIDKCEENKEEAWKGNVVTTKNIIELCKKYNKKLVYLSSECVFSGQSVQYFEDDERNPINYYGKTKKAAEDLIMQSSLNYLIIRSVIAYGGSRTSTTIVNNMLNQLMTGNIIMGVTDQLANFTYVGDIIKAIFTLVNKDMTGIFHVGGSTIISPYQLAVKICEKMNVSVEKVRATTLDNFFLNKSRLRLRNSVLNSDKYINLIKDNLLGVDEGLNKTVDYLANH